MTHSRPGPAVRHPARAGRHARGARSSCRTARTSRPPGRRWSRATRSWRPGGASVRFARNGDYAEPDDRARRRRRGGDDPAGLGRRPDGRPTRRGSATDPRAARGAVHARPSSASWPIGSASPRTAPSSASSGGRARRPARRRRARRPRPHGTPGARSNRSSTRRTSRWPSRSSRRSPTRSPTLRRRAAGHRPSDRRGAARRAVDRGRRRRAASRRRVRGRPLRDRRDQGARADLEGRAVRGRPRLDRPPGPDRPGGANRRQAILSRCRRSLPPHHQLARARATSAWSSGACRRARPIRSWTCPTCGSATRPSGVTSRRPPPVAASPGPG